MKNPILPHHGGGCLAAVLGLSVYIIIVILDNIYGKPPLQSIYREYALMLSGVAMIIVAMMAASPQFGDPKLSNGCLILGVLLIVLCLVISIIVHIPHV